MTQWQVELPWLPETHTQFTLSPHLAASKANKKLLQYWLENASQIMVLDPNVNPLSFPIVEHLLKSPSLVHIIQSVSAAHQTFFGSDSLALSLRERSSALTSVRQELQAIGKHPRGSLLTVLMLGISTSWMQEQPHDFGVEHLFGARAIIDQILGEENENNRNDPFTHFLIGVFIYWDMTCSFLIDSSNQQPLNTPLIYGHIQEVRGTYHPMNGYAVEIIYLLGFLGRYCRTVIDTGQRDLLLEATLEEQLLEWDTAQDDRALMLLSDSFRKHGLITLYRICGRQKKVPCVTEEREASFIEETEEIIRDYALQIIDQLSDIKLTSSYLGLQSIPLMTAGSELAEGDVPQQEEVSRRFRALYSLQRLSSNLRAIELLEEVWRMRDSGVKISWLELMLQKNWRLRLG